MKIISKFLLAIMTTATIGASMAATSFAAGNIEFSLTPASTEVNAGETVVVTLAADESTGFSIITGQIEFEEGFSVTKKKTAGDDYEDGELSTTYGKDGAVSPYTVMIEESEGNKAVFTGDLIKLTFTVADTVSTGDYTIKFVPTKVLGDNENDIVSTAEATTTIHVVGKTTTKDANFVASLKYDNTKTGVRFSVTTDDSTKTVKTVTKDVAFKGTIEAASEVKMGLKITGVPSTVNLSATAELY